jgi:hypothetical protein
MSKLFALLHRIDWWFYRWKLRVQLIVNSGDMLNRRVEVENVLLSVASGKRQPLTPDECKALAYKLGMPTKRKR